MTSSPIVVNIGDMSCQGYGCDRTETVARGLCGRCYARARSSGEIPRRPPKSVRCETEGCDREVMALGKCQRCYLREKRRKAGIAPKRPSGGPCSVADCQEPSIQMDLCQRHYMHAYHARDPDRRKRLALKVRFGTRINLEQYREMLASQHGVCAICKSPPNRRMLHIDHDHQTGNIRALLCHGCNTGLGLFREDSALLTAAIEYLERYRKCL